MSADKPKTPRRSVAREAATTVAPRPAAKGGPVRARCHTKCGHRNGLAHPGYIDIFPDAASVPPYFEIIP